MTPEERWEQWQNDSRDPEPSSLPSLPWTWKGGYPQRITGPDATLIAEVFEDPDRRAVIAPTICAAVNAYFGWGFEKIMGEEDWSVMSGALWDMKRQRDHAVNELNRLRKETQ